MSSTRNAEKYTNLWETPLWVVRRLLEEVYLPPGSWLEPTAGNGRIIQAMAEDRPDAYQFTAVEIRKECSVGLANLPNVVSLHGGVDFLTWNARDHRGEAPCSDGSYFTGSILNPPFDISMDVVNKCLTVCDQVFVLQRLNWLGSGTNNGKNEFFREFMPDVYVVPDRVQFLLDGEFPRHPEGAVNAAGKSIAGHKMGGDSIEYCWYHWGEKAGRFRNAGKISCLRETSLEERQAG